LSTTTLISDFIVDQYRPGISPGELDADYDLLANGVIDSLGLLRLIEWLQSEFAVDIDDRELSPDSFRTVSAIRAFVESR
jgi:acyl carrier protein